MRGGALYLRTWMAPVTFLVLKVRPGHSRPVMPGPGTVNQYNIFFTREGQERPQEILESWTENLFPFLVSFPRGWGKGSFQSGYLVAIVSG